MSIEAMAWAKQQTVGGVAPKAVLMILADYADEHGKAWPSQGVIAAQAEITPRSVREQLAVLEERGFIRREARFRDDGSRTSDVIELSLDLPARPRIPPERRSTPPERRSYPPEQNSGVPERASAPPRNVVPIPPEPGSGLTTFEPPLEPKDSVASAAPKPTKSEPWLSDEKFQAFWKAATPEMRRRAKSQSTVWPEWRKATAKARPDDLILALSRYLQGDPDVQRTGGPGLQRWLKDRVYDQWLADDPAPILAEPIDPDEAWRRALRSFTSEKLIWRDDLGPRPGRPGCRVPIDLLTEFGIIPASAPVLDFRQTEGTSA